MLNCWVVLKSYTAPVAHRVVRHIWHSKHVGYAHHVLHPHASVQAISASPSIPQIVCSAVGSPLKRGLLSKPFALLPPALVGGGLLFGPTAAGPIPGEFSGGSGGGVYAAGSGPGGGFLAPGSVVPASFTSPAVPDSGYPTSPTALDIVSPGGTGNGTGGLDYSTPGMPYTPVTINSPPTVSIPGGTTPAGDTSTPGGVVPTPEPPGLIVLLFPLAYFLFKRWKKTQWEC